MSEYTPLSFVPGEVLTSTKMNMLAQNDASFANGSGINENALDGAKIKDGSIEPVKLKATQSVSRRGEPTAAQTKNSEEVIWSSNITHTSKTGKVLVLTTAMMSVSRYTGGYRVRQGTQAIDEARTNSSDRPVPLTTFTVANAPVDVPTRYDLVGWSQDSGTTWTVHGYHYVKIVVIDI